MDHRRITDRIQISFFFAHVCIRRGLDVGEIDGTVSLWVLRVSNVSERIKALQASCGSYRLRGAGRLQRLVALSWVHSRIVDHTRGEYLLLRTKHLYCTVSALGQLSWRLGSEQLYST
jgi:hypothetical protein